MIVKYLNNKSSFFVIAIPIALLLFSLTLSTNTNNNLADINPYLNKLPTNYAKIINNNTNDSIFFSSIFEKDAIRELLVVKLFPNKVDIKQNFNVKLSLSENSKVKDTILNLKIVNDAVKYNYNGKTYGVFKAAIPLINIDKIEIENSGGKPWKTTIKDPFNILESKDERVGVLNKNNKGAAPNPFLPLFLKALELNDIMFLPHTYGTKGDSLFRINSNLMSFISDKNLTIAYVDGIEKFENLINKKDKSASRSIIFKGKNEEQANKLIEAFAKESIKMGQVFNITKLAKYNALKNVFTNGCDDRFYLLYNENDNLIEPIFIRSSCLGEMTFSIRNTIIRNERYHELFFKVLYNLSELDLYNYLIEGNTEFKKEVELINKYNPNLIFNADILKINQRVIKKSLDPSKLVISELISIDKNKIIVSIKNISEFPIDVFGLLYKQNKVITKLDSSKRILRSQKDIVYINLPTNFQNLFVSKKQKRVGFNLSRHIYDLKIAYRITGLNEVYNSSIVPYEQKEKIKDDLFRSNTFINRHKYISVDTINKKISFSKNTITISSPLVIPGGFVFELNPGDKLDIVKGGKIISHSPIDFKGTEKDPIEIFSSDKKGQGIIVLSEGKQSNLEFVTFDYLTNPSHGYWSVTGAVTFYESPVNLINVRISNNRCEDALNIVRTTFTMKQCNISNTQSDAFDGDFVKGTIVDCFFDNLGNDAIDVSGSELTINRLVVSNAGDKGLSAGEDSKMTLDDVHIFDSEIAIAGKDLSIIDGKNIVLENTKLGLTAFQKKPEFGASDIRLSKVEMINVKTQYLIESSSSLYIDGKRIETTQNVKDRMYGVEFGVSSEKTKKGINDE